MAFVFGRACQSGTCASPCCPTVTITDVSATAPAAPCQHTGGVVIGTVTNCCPWELSESGSGPNTPYTAIYRYYDFAALPAAKDIRVIWDWFTVAANQLSVLWWNGTACNGYTSECALGSGSIDLTVPAGTIRLAVLLTGACNSPEGTDQYSLSIACL